MIKRTVGILDQNEAYLHRLMSFARTSQAGQQFILKAFSHWPSVMACDEAIDILLADPRLLQDIEGSAACKVVYLIDQERKETEHEDLYLYRYQPLNQLFDRLAALVMDLDSPKRVYGTNPGQAQVIAIFSAGGGSGKTTLAINLARSLSQKGNKVFYLNMETFSCGQLFSASGQRPFEKMLYYVKSKADSLPTKLAWLKMIEPATKLEYIEPCGNPLEMEEMTDEDTLFLLEGITHLNYDYIIIDCSSCFHQRIMTSLAWSHHILWLIHDDFQLLDKTKAALLRFQQAALAGSEGARPKIHFILNKYTGHVLNPIKEYGFTPAAYLPYIPNWKSVNHVQALAAESSYNDELMKWFLPLVERTGGEALG
ncbi:AAA family ATPase [Paenibacillus senegalensis]|uniref:AAA family ATPase n=1 Tax=Paenibacillus senegalensis TaxID=1465766 RepID=UPI000288AAF8|nr:AAA family ATPase [Paenibacillus senegalensis]